MSSDHEIDLDGIEWLVISETIEERTRHYHGDDRANPLAQHHKNVLVLAKMYDWALARNYDRHIQELMANDNRHDPTDIDQAIVQQASIERDSQKWRLSS